MSGVRISYVNFHGRKFIDFDALVQALREATAQANGSKPMLIDLDKLVEWLESVEYPEERVL